MGRQRMDGRTVCGQTTTLSCGRSLLEDIVPGERLGHSSESATGHESWLPAVCLRVPEDRPSLPLSHCLSACRLLRKDPSCPRQDLSGPAQGHRMARPKYPITLSCPGHATLADLFSTRWPRPGLRAALSSFCWVGGREGSLGSQVGRGHPWTQNPGIWGLFSAPQPPCQSGAWCPGLPCPLPCPLPPALRGASPPCAGSPAQPHNYAYKI